MGAVESVFSFPSSRDLLRFFENFLGDVPTDAWFDLSHGWTGGFKNFELEVESGRSGVVRLSGGVVS